MNWTEKRHQRKKAEKSAKNSKPGQSTSPSPEQQTFSIQQLLDLAVGSHTAGFLPEAEGIYRRILRTDPDQPEALHLLGMIAHQLGKKDIAVDLITKALAIKPGYAEAHNNLGLALHGLGKLDEAVASYHKALAIEPDNAETHNNLGNALKDLGRLDEAVLSYRKSLAINSDYANAHYNLGNALKDLRKFHEAVESYQKALTLKPGLAKAHNNLGLALHSLGKLDEAVASYHKALAIEPDNAEAHNNLGIVLIELGRSDEAVLILQTAIEKDSENGLLFYSLINFLNNHMPKARPYGPHAKTQSLLQQVKSIDVGETPIPDETVNKIYQQCHDILISQEMNPNVSMTVLMTQIWRGEKDDPGCTRHKLVFSTYNIIPEYCFSCYKVFIEVQDVVDLFKLLMIFDSIELPRDNTRKCLVEVRPGISGAYKGLIYCQNYDEAKELLNVAQTVLNEKINNTVTLSIKMGCSEFPIAYPEYGRIEDDKGPPMTYNEEWRDHEDYVDRNLLGYQPPIVFDTYNHSGFTLRDVIVMRTWLAYAATIGDSSYLKISAGPLQKLPIEKRPPFNM